MVHIAVVGDDSAFSDAVGRHLADRGWDVSVCGAGQDAFTFILHERPEVLLLHIRPDKSEREWSLLRRLQDGVQTYDLPVIVCTPDREEFHALQAFLQQRDIEVWYPPFELGVLEELIQTAQLKADRRRRERYRKSPEDVERGRRA